MPITEDPASRTSPAQELIPDIYDPTAGTVAISRELASEQVRMIADPAPLGLAAFALTTFLLSLVNAGIMPKDTEPVVLGVALAFGGIAQLLAGMWVPFADATEDRQWIHVDPARASTGPFGAIATGYLTLSR